MSTAPDFLPGLDEAAFTRASAAGEPPLLRAKREEAFAAYARTPAPTNRDEEWRRTDPALFPFGDFAPLPALAPEVEYAAELVDSEFDVTVTVTTQGFAIGRRNPNANVLVLPLAEAAVSHAALVAKYLQGPALPEQPRKFTSLVDAFWNFGLLILAPRGAQIEHGVLVRYDLGVAASLRDVAHRDAATLQSSAAAAGGAADAATLLCSAATGRSSAATRGHMILPRLLVIAEDGSSLKVAEYYRSRADAAVLSVSSREMYVGENATLKIAALQEWSDDSLHIGEDWSRVERDGKIDWVTLALGSKVSKQMCCCDVRAPNANAFMSGLYFASGDQHIDQRTLQKHSSHHTYSNLLYKGAVKDNAHSVYQGIIAAGRGAIKVDAYQMNKNLVLSPNARADSLPGLEIDADDLKCSHGSTVGTLDPEQLFYLMSRGLSRAEARQMLVNAFFEEVTAKVPWGFMQDRIRHHVAEKMK